MARVKSPGVYIQEESNPSLTAAQSSLRTVAVVATAPTTITSRVTVTPDRTGGNLIDTVTGITSSNLIGLYVGDTLIPSSNYVITDDTVTWDAASNYLTLSQYTAIFTIAKTSDYYDAKTWFVYDQTFTDSYGFPIVNNSVNPLGAAVYLAFNAGAQRVISVQASSSGSTDIKTAIDKLQEESVDYIIVPEATSTTLQNYIKDHVDIQSSTEGRMERKAFIAPILLTDSISTITAQAESFVDERIWPLAPGGVTMTLTNGATDTVVTLSSIYAGASLAGRLADPTKRIAKPLTRESVANVDSVNVKYKKSEKETLAGSGVTVLSADAFGTVRVHQALTSDMSNYNRQAISIVNIKDEIRKIVRSGLENSYIGQELNPLTSPSDVIGSINSILTTQLGVLIAGFANVTASVDSTGSAINVSFDISVIRPFDYINITFKVVV